ncbi:MAG: sulfatase-like hydrolase/transferase [Deltaproteobacteria bacterium]|nr:sulfatase-like hydrolase/transferase [Deltaproteobacteria bacterium]
MAPVEQSGQEEGSRWGQRLVLVAAVLLVGAGGVTLLVAAMLHWRSLPVSPARRISGPPWAALEPADRIEATSGALAGWNVLVVTLDTTRADRLGAYGNREIETPVLDKLAREGLLFANAMTTVPATMPAHSSLMTGLYPFHHGVRANGTFRLEEEQITLAEILSNRGVRTAAAVSAYVLDSSYGLDQGFESYLDDLTRGIQHAPQMFRERPAELANQAAVEWLRGHVDERFFLWLHYFDPHAPYLPPEPFRLRYLDNPYDGEIAYVDQQLGVLLDELVALGVRDRTLVVVTADHGEGLGEHGEFTHSLFLYDATLRVPLIVHAPTALPQGRVIERQVSLVDVVPTVLDLLGIDAPGGLDGRSLLDQLPPEPRPIYVETLATMTLHGWAPLFGVRREDFKYVFAPRPELYDLRHDPGELENLFEERSGIARELHRVLVDLAGEDPHLVAPIVPNMEVDDASREALAALGYIVTTGEAAEEDAPIDPKDGIAHWERVQRGVFQRNSGDAVGAIKTLEAALEAVPRDVFALQVLAGAYLLQGRAEEALERALAAETLEGSNPSIPLLVASVHLDRRELERAEAAIGRARAIQADDPHADSLAARVAALRGDAGEALRLLQRALALDRGARRAQLLNQLADLHLERGSRDEARTAFEEALETDAFNGQSHAGLAEILWDDGNADKAHWHLAQGLRFNPVQPRALSVLCGVRMAEKRFEAAIAACERALEITPVYGPAHANLGLAYRRKGDLARAEQVYRNGIERAPGYAALYQNLAQLLLRQGREEEAAATFERAALLDPDNAVVLANLAVYHIKIGRSDSARLLLTRAVQVDPDYAFAHKQLGVLSLAEQDKSRAQFHLARSLALDPSQPDAGMIRFQLDQIEDGRP